MALSRRGFLGLTAAAAAGFALDPERLLWVKGAKTIFLPPTTVLAAEATDVEALIAGLGGPWLLTASRNGTRTAVWGTPANPETIVRQLSDREYELLVDRGRKMLSAPRVALAADIPEGPITREQAAKRWPSPPHERDWRKVPTRGTTWKDWDTDWDTEFDG